MSHRKPCCRHSSRHCFPEELINAHCKMCVCVSPPAGVMDKTLSSSAPVVQVCFPNVRAQVLDNLNRQREEGRLCDLSIQVQGQVFRAHRCVLAASSPYFHDQVCKTNLKNNNILPGPGLSLISSCSLGFNLDRAIRQKYQITILEDIFTIHNVYHDASFRYQTVIWYLIFKPSLTIL